MMFCSLHQALELIKLGADPNGRDQSGIPVLNWSVMMCMPQVVKALVDRKASLTYQSILKILTDSVIKTPHDPFADRAHDVVRSDSAGSRDPHSHHPS